MDPVFGLPCVSETRAMDNARNRNFYADKSLAQKFESLDLAKKSASGKFLSSRCDAEDFLDSLDLCSTGKQSPQSRRVGRPLDKKSPGNSSPSMSLQEFDKMIMEAKDHKTLQPQHSSTARQHRSVLGSAKACNPNSAIITKNTENDAQGLKIFDSDTKHIVDLEQRERCLPINRQKHAMREAWERATSDDFHQKRQRAQLSQKTEQQRSSSAHRAGQDKRFPEHLTQNSKSISAKNIYEAKKQKS